MRTNPLRSVVLRPSTTSHTTCNSARLCSLLCASNSTYMSTELTKKANRYANGIRRSQQLHHRQSTNHGSSDRGRAHRRRRRRNQHGGMTMEMVLCWSFAILQSWIQCMNTTSIDVFSYDNGNTVYIVYVHVPVVWWYGMLLLYYRMYRVWYMQIQNGKLELCGPKSMCATQKLVKVN